MKTVQSHASKTFITSLVVSSKNYNTVQKREETPQKLIKQILIRKV